MAVVYTLRIPDHFNLYSFLVVGVWYGGSFSQPGHLSSFLFSHYFCHFSSTFQNKNSIYRHRNINYILLQ